MAKVTDMLMGKLKPSKEQQTAEILNAKLERMWTEASNERKQHDWKWYMWDLWVNGYHYARYDKRTKQVISKPGHDGRPKVVVNKIYPTLRSVRNYVLRNQPKAQVTPENLTSETLKEANKATKFLDYTHETENLRPKLKGSVWQALEFSAAWWQILWNGEKIEVNPVDIFDYYPDPKARNPKEQRYGVLAVRRRISDLLENPEYDKGEVDQVKPDNKLAASSYKEMLLSYDNPRGGNSDDKDGTTIVQEFWYKDEGKVYKCTRAGGRIIKKPEQVNTPIIPFFKLASDIKPFSMYGEGWVKNMVDPQKMLNSAASSIVEYNLIMNKVKVVADRGAGVRVIRNEHGEIIEKKRGYTLTTQNSAPLNESIFRQIELANLFIEDMGAMHDASRGRAPMGGVNSGVALQTLQVGDSNNLSEVVENVEDFLEDCYEYILWLASQHYQDMQDIIVNDYSGARSFLKVIGSTSPVAASMQKNGEVPEDVLIVNDKNLVDVKISSYLSYTPEAKRETVKDLVRILPNLPEDIILDAYGVGNIADVIEGIREKQAREKAEALETKKAEVVQTQEITNPQNGGQEAFAAVRTILGGGAPQVPANPGQEYFDVFDQQIAKAQEMGDVPPEMMDAMQTFRDQVAQGVGR